jgi:hypothetical protein
MLSFLLIVLNSDFSDRLTTHNYRIYLSSEDTQQALYDSVFLKEKLHLWMTWDQDGKSLYQELTIVLMTGCSHICCDINILNSLLKSRFCLIFSLLLESDNDIKADN